MKIIIVGAGEVGFHIAQKLSAENQNVVLIDKDGAKIKRITESLDIQALLGGGTSPQLLKDAGIKEADMLVAATDSDEVNLICCLMARNINPHMLKIARIRNPEYLEQKELFEQDLLGIDRVINPESEMVDTILSVMEVPGASEVINFVGGRVKLIGFNIHEDSPFAGHKLVSFGGLEEKLLMGAIARGDQVLIPRGDDIIQAEDLVYVVIKNEDIERIRRLFNPQAQTLRRVIIVGAGQTGTALANALDKTKAKTKIIDKDSERCTRLSEQLERVIVINGDGTDRDLLREENIEVLTSWLPSPGMRKAISYFAPCQGAWTGENDHPHQQIRYIPLMSAIGIDTVVSPRLSAVKAIIQHIRRGKLLLWPL